MAVFGAVKTHEDDPIRAIMAAQEIHEKVRDIGNAVEKIKSPFYMHTGINTGPAIAGDMDVDRGTHGILGSTVNLASRLHILAKEDEIVVGAETLRHAQWHFHFERMEPVKVKGKEDYITPYKFWQREAIPGRPAVLPACDRSWSDGMKR